MVREIKGMNVTRTHLIVCFSGGVQHDIEVSHPNFKVAMRALKAHDAEALFQAMTVQGAIKASLNQISQKSEGKVIVRDGKVFYNEEQVDNTIASRLLEMVQQEIDGTFLARFLENLMANPSFRSREQLGGFLDHGKFAITPDGHFLAYRVVDNNFMSHHANPDGSRNRNKVGDVVEMKRKDVDDDPNRTCSKGLHFCSLGYIPHYYASGKTVIVKINPADVVSIPRDYNNTKGRCCKYAVVAEYDKVPLEDAVYEVKSVSKEDFEDDIPEDAFIEQSSVELKEEDKDTIRQAVEDFGNLMGKKPDGSNFWNKRDSSGRFTAK